MSVVTWFHPLNEQPQQLSDIKDRVLVSRDISLKYHSKQMNLSHQLFVQIGCEVAETSLVPCTSVTVPSSSRGRL